MAAAVSPFTWLDPYRWLLYLALFGALVLGYFAWADHVGDVRETKVRDQYAKQAKTTDEKRAAITPPIVKKEAAAQIKIRTITQTIIKKVPVYVQATDCPMPGGFRVLHDAAAHGELPDAARIPDAAAVPAQDVASTVAENYGTCREVAQRLTSLQEWVRAQATIKK